MARAEIRSKEIYDIFTELDPLGTGRSKPYMDKKDFFQELKNPPKKQLKDLKGSDSSTDGNNVSTYFTGASKSLFSEENNEKLYEERFQRYKSVDSVPPLADNRITLAEELAKSDGGSGCHESGFSVSAVAAVTDPFETSFANFATFGKQNGDDNGGHDDSQSRRSSVSQFYQQHNLNHRRSLASNQGENTLTHQLKHISMQNVIDNDSSGVGNNLSMSSASKSVYKPSSAAEDTSNVLSISSQTKESFMSRNSVTPPLWNRSSEDSSKQKIVINLRKVLSNADDTDKENDSPVMEDATVLRNPDAVSPAREGDVSSDSFESIPEPPPRPITSPIVTQPPPLPPKKLPLPITMKPPPPRPSSSEASSHYDFIENYESSSCLRQRRLNGTDIQIPPLPAPARKPKYAQQEHDRHDIVARHRPQKYMAASAVEGNRSTLPSKINEGASIESDYYLMPISKFKEESGSVKKKPSLNITISQLTSTGFEDLAAVLRIPTSALSKMTLKELTECLSRLSDAECQKLEHDMNSKNRCYSNAHSYQKYHSLNESFDTAEDESLAYATFKANFKEKFPSPAAATMVTATTTAVSAVTTSVAVENAQVDKYAVFRELIEQEEKNSQITSLQKDMTDNKTENTLTERLNYRDTIAADSLDSTDAKTKYQQSSSEMDDKDRYAALRTISEQKVNLRTLPLDHVTEQVISDHGDKQQQQLERSESRLLQEIHTSDYKDSGNGKKEEDEYNDKKRDKNDEKSGDTVSNHEVTPVVEDNLVDNASKMKIIAVLTEVLPNTNNFESGIKDENNIEDGDEDVETRGLIGEFGKNWAKFDSEHDSKEDQGNTSSPWLDQNKDSDFGESKVETATILTPAKMTEFGKRIPQRKGWNRVEYDEDDDDEEAYVEDENEGEVEDEGENENEEFYEDEDYGDDSDENWESSKRSLASSWDESSWRENGWSDRDSLYDDAEASPVPTVSSSYRLQPPYHSRKGYRRKCLPPKKFKMPIATSISHTRWDEESPGWPRYLYKEYGVKPETELVYGDRKMKTPPWSSAGAGGGSSSSERKRYESNVEKEEEEDDEDELMLLKMMLGRKRLKALEEQLFKHYREQLSEGPPIPSLPPSKRYYNHTAAAAAAAAVATAKIASKQDYELSASSKRMSSSRHYGKKHYTTMPRPKSADKNRKSLSIRQDDTEELFTNRKYRRPYSQDELSFSEEEKFIHKSPSTCKRSTRIRSRHQSQTSPFEDNFTPPPSVDSIGPSAVVFSSKIKNPATLSPKSLRYKKTAATIADSKKLQTLSSGDLHPYIAYDLKSGHSSHESSQQHSPFEDDFTPSETQHPCASDSSSKEQGCVRRFKDDDSFFTSDAVLNRFSRSTVTRTNPAVSRYEHPQRTMTTTIIASGSAASTDRAKKYYENVELRKKTSSPLRRRNNSDESTPLTSNIVDKKSPRKTMAVYPSSSAPIRRHDPFNDKAATEYYSRTVPKIQKAKSRSKVMQTYDNGGSKIVETAQIRVPSSSFTSDVVETSATENASVVTTTAPTNVVASSNSNTVGTTGGVKWEDNLSSFALSESQHQTHK